MTLWITKNHLLSLLIILILFVCYTSLWHHVFATSPSFSYKEIRNEFFNWIDVHKHVRSYYGDPSPELIGVNYFSDGKTLNATLWLAAPLNINISHDKGQINYGVFIDAHNKTRVGQERYRLAT
jgi:hypothetical protein